MTRDPFVAIADPNRREIISLLSDGEKTINQLSAHFSMSRPAVSKHIKIMEECGVINILASGRERRASLDYSALQEISIWLDKYEVFWEKNLNNLGEFLASED